MELTMKRYIKSSADKFGGYKPIKSVTSEVKPLIENERIRKNVSAIWLVCDPDEYVEVKNTYYDPDDEDDDEFDYVPKEYYMIFFKPRTQLNVYDGVWSDGTVSEVVRDFDKDIKFMNSWLNEVMLDPKYYAEEGIVIGDSKYDF